ncbi:Hypothetical predicted protein [Mytilus galloprovincialis]|uniref:Uncharacterized protein n=1 Tax=Mytilus galloprovincialis TaxID=29158 RepID=A0A8B6FMC1_MYTGA|nr:Hypothetical predicted protein [Mytilus galloprovincialis]
MLRRTVWIYRRGIELFSSTIQSSRTETGPLNLNGTTQEAGVGPRKSELGLSVIESNTQGMSSGGSYSGPRAIPLVEKCEVPQGNLVTAALLTGDKEGSVANIMRKPIGAILGS